MRFSKFWGNLLCLASMKRLQTQHGRLTCALVVTLIFFASYTLLENSKSGMKGYYRRRNILPIVRLSDYDTEDAQKAKHLYPRQILVWASGIGEKGPNPSENVFCLKTKQLESCPYKCDFTTDRSYFEIADAVIFDGSKLHFKKKSVWESIWSGFYEEPEDIPEFRMHRQFWIFFMMQPPVHFSINLKPFEGLFNWTMSYRRDSDVHTPYGRLSLQKTKNADIRKTLNHQNASHNTDFHSIKLATWMIARNCQHKSYESKHYVEELQKYISIDVLCENHNCTSPHQMCENPFSCYKRIGTKYKFYLAFENALCVDYITEQFFSALQFDMVPVVFGQGDYSKFSPKSSYIDARSFESPKKLADYLLFLDTNPDEYKKYFEWKKSYYVHELSYLEDAWCILCEKLWKTRLNTTYRQSPSAQNLDNWWYHNSESSFEPACSRK